MEEQQMQLLDGKAVAAQMKQEIAAEVAQIKANGGKVPHLAAILVGHDGGSETYVASKVKTCEEVGFKSSLIRYEEDVTEEELLRKVDELNNDPDVDGFIVQLPLPASSRRCVQNTRYGRPSRDAESAFASWVGSYQPDWRLCVVGPRSVRC